MVDPNIIFTIVGSFGACIATTITMFIWATNRSEETRKEMKENMKEFQKETKDFHARLCTLEERYLQMMQRYLEDRK